MRTGFLGDRIKQLTGQRSDALFPDYSQRAIPAATEQEDDAPEKAGRLSILLSTGKLGVSLAVLGAALITITACATSATLTPEGTATPPPALEPTPPNTPTPEPTPTIDALIDDLITQNGATALTITPKTYNAAEETREIGFIVSQKFFKLITDHNLTVILQTTDKTQTVTPLPTPTTAGSLHLPANDYNLHILQENETPSPDTLLNTIQVQAETTPEKTARIRRESLEAHRTINDTFKQWATEQLDDDAQAEVLAKKHGI